MKKLILLFLLMCTTAYADVDNPTEWTELDGAPSVFDPWKVAFSNGSMTDNGDGSISISSAGGSGDITSVGDVASGAAFDGTQGTTLTFNNAGGDATQDYDGTDFTFSKPITVSGSTSQITGNNSVYLNFDTANKIELGKTAAENLLADFATTSNTVALSSTTGVTILDTGTIGITSGGLGTFNANLTIGNGATTAGVLKLLEDTDAGSNFASFQSPSLAANTVYTLPSNDGDASQFLQTDGSGGLTWAAPAGSGDITSVGDVASGAAFDGTQGTILTFNNAGGDKTLDYDGTDFLFNAPLSVDASDPADSGAIRLDNNESIAWEASPAGTDVTLLVDSSEIFQFSTGVTTAGDLTITGDDIFMTTNTSGAALIADGTNFNPVVISGDVTIGTTGIAAIQANSVALGTDTTNAYVADLTAGTAIDVSGGGAETANVTVNWDSTEVEATTWGAGGNASNAWTFDLSGTDPVMTAVSGGFSATGTLTASGLITANSNATIGNGATTAGVLKLLEDTDAGSNFASFQVPALAADTVYILPADDGDAGEFLQTNGSGTLDWVASAGSGDITSVGDVTSGAAFDGTQGTIMTFNNAGGDATVDYDGTDFTFSKAVTVAGSTSQITGNNSVYFNFDTANKLEIGKTAAENLLFDFATTANTVTLSTTTGVTSLDTGSINLSTNSLSTTAQATKTANYTLTTSDNFIEADATGGSFTVTTPTAVGATGRIYTVKRINSGANTVTIDGNAAETIDGDATVILVTQYTSLEIQSNGTNWRII